MTNITKMSNAELAELLRDAYTQPAVMEAARRLSRPEPVADERAAFEASNVTGRLWRSSEPGYTDQYADSHTQMAWLAWQARAALDIRDKVDSERWRFWRNKWPALCRFEIARFAGLDLSRINVETPEQMDAVTDAAIESGKGVSNG